ncbi:MAG TPA: phage tail sheath C-terminal domain-containing protein [Thermoanaerobaculia bacterium]|nr:phage tail sheath C-terminal domain-containing protein [Thermoanaerobaculia bacterium]
MPITPTYPGVYIEEIPSGVRTIAGVATSVAAFVDYFRRGPMNQAVEIFSFADFERTFGGLDLDSEASYAIQQFFLNGGTDAWVVRVAAGAAAAATTVLEDGVGGTPQLTVAAASAGTWGNNLRLTVDWPTANRFNLTISEVDPATGAVLRQESFLGLAMTAGLQKALAQGSQLVVIPPSPPIGSNLPLPTGTSSADLALPFSLPVSADDRMVKVTFTRTTPVTETVNLGKDAIASLDEAAGRLQAAIRAAKPEQRSWSQATVRVVPGLDPNTGRLQVTAGLIAPDAIITFSDPPTKTTAKDLKLVGAKVQNNVAAYSVGATTAAGAQGAGTQGADGVPPDAAALLGSQAVDPPTGMFALDKVSLFNILCLPRIARADGDHPFSAGVDTVISTATTYCESRRAFLVLDTPTDVKNLPQVKTWLGNHASLRHKNVAFYFPRVEIADPVSAFRPRSFGASGTIAGLYARTDAGRGVWKAPAGTEAVLRGVQSLDYTMTDAENGALNPLAINALRNFPVYGTVCWGARTLDGSDQQASEWKYIPVRRLALFLEESLYRGTQWVVFEPNDEPLWSQIRLNVGAFMHNLFRQGAFQGSSPREAYLVKCDRETTTQNDINLGIVNIVVGFAPLKPAEFVILKIQQLAGQIQT